MLMLARSSITARSKLSAALAPEKLSGGDLAALVLLVTRGMHAWVVDRAGAGAWHTIPWVCIAPQRCAALQHMPHCAARFKRHCTAFDPYCS